MPQPKGSNIAVLLLREDGFGLRCNFRCLGGIYKPPIATNRLVLRSCGYLSGDSEPLRERLNGLPAGTPCILCLQERDHSDKVLAEVLMAERQGNKVRWEYRSRLGDE